MKSLNDNLRDEFQEILEDYELSILINTNRDFETYIINELKSQQH